MIKSWSFTHLPCSVQENTMSRNFSSKFSHLPRYFPKITIVNRISKTYPDVACYGLDVTEVDGASKELTVKGLPMVAFFKNGQKIDELVGMLNPKSVGALLQTHLPGKDIEKGVDAIDLLDGLGGKAVADQDVKDENLEPGTCTTCHFQLVVKGLSRSARESSSTWDRKVSLDKLAANAESCEYCRFLLQTCERDLVLFKHVKGMGGEVGMKVRRGETGLPRLDLDGQFGEAHAVIQGPFKPMMKSKPFNSRILRWDTKLEGDAAHFSGRLVGKQVDFSLCREWLTSCVEHHKNTCMEETIDPTEFGMRLINVKTRCVVDAPNDVKYVALSYVWGAEEVAHQLMLSEKTYQRLVKPEGLSDLHSDIPKTIRDAMAVTAMLGFDYLWVDALCIRQDDKADQHRQIWKMDRVYSCAALTIVSTEPHANCAIPGLREDTRAPNQAVCKVGKINLINTLPTLSQSFLASVWDTRGWTLQEKALSKRLLVFTSSQAYWLCNATVYAEDTNLEISADTRSLKDILRSYEGRSFGTEILERVYKPSFNDSTPEDNYQSLLRLYMMRDLTNHSDAIHAFAAFLNVLAPEMGSHHCGLPERRFAWAMLWRLRRHFPERRTKDFPSWSWAGWRSGKDVTMIDVTFSTSTKIWWWKMDSAGKLALINPRQEDVDVTGSEYTHEFFGVDPTSPPPRLEEIQSKLSEDSREWPNTLNKTHILRFWTSVASITIGRAPGQAHGKNCSGYPIHVPGQEGSVSTIVLDNAWREEQPGDQFDFIFLTRTVEDPKFKYDIRLETMLIEWKQGIAYRVQQPMYHLRLIHWEAAKPQFKLITLA